MADTGQLSRKRVSTRGLPWTYVVYVRTPNATGGLGRTLPSKHPRFVTALTKRRNCVLKRAVYSAWFCAFQGSHQNSVTRFWQQCRIFVIEKALSLRFRPCGTTNALRFRGTTWSLLLEQDVCSSQTFSLVSYFCQWLCREVLDTFHSYFAFCVEVLFGCQRSDLFDAD